MSAAENTSRRYQLINPIHVLRTLDIPQLKAIALGPVRWETFLNAHSMEASDGVEEFITPRNLAPPQSRTRLRLNPRHWKTLALVPGGRYLLVLREYTGMNQPELKLWDLGHPVRGLRARPKLIAREKDVPLHATFWSLACTEDRLRVVVGGKDPQNNIFNDKTQK